MVFSNLPLHKQYNAQTAKNLAVCYDVNGNLLKKYKTPEFRSKRLFQGLIFHINGYTVPVNSNKLIEIILFHCGKIDFYPSRYTNIIIAENLSNSKDIQYNSGMFKGIFVLKSKYILDCVLEGQLIDLKIQKNYQKYRTQHEILDTKWTSEIYKQVVKERMKYQFDDGRYAVDFTESGQEDEKEEEGEAKSDSAAKSEVDSKNLDAPLDPDSVEVLPLSKLPKSFTDFNPDTHDVVSDFYSRSRLSKISDMRNKFQLYLKEKIREAKEQAKAAKDQPETEASSISPPAVTSKTLTYVLHIDLDCFFVSVARKLNPALIGKCVAVCYKSAHAVKNSETNNFSASEISSCSYEARQYGVKANMYFSVAKNLCPDLIPTPYNFEEIEKVAKIFYDLAISEFGCLKVRMLRFRNMGRIFGDKIVYFLDNFLSFDSFLWFLILPHS